MEYEVVLKTNIGITIVRRNARTSDEAITKALCWATSQFTYCEVSAAYPSPKMVAN